MAAAAVDLERFRLRRFVEELAAAGELETRSGPTRLADIARALEANPKAVLFETVGRDGFALVGNVLGSRKRFAQAFGVTPQKLLPEILARLRGKAEFVEVGREQAPAQEIVQTGAEVDLTKLPAHLQHGKDGGPYISAGMDFTLDPATGLTNVGLRRFMLRGRATTGVDLVAPSDLRNIYLAALARGERLPLSVVVGGHPVDYFGATMRMPGDELSLLARAARQRRCRWSRASPTTSWCRPMPNGCSKAIWARKAIPRPRAPMASSSATTAGSRPIRSFMSPRSRAAATRCSRP